MPMKIVRFVMTSVLLVVIVLAAVVLVRAMMFSPPQSRGLPSFTERSPDINEQRALANFSHILTFRTESTEDGQDHAVEFEKLHDYFRQAYPLIFSKLEYTPIGRYGMLFKWQGRDAALKPALYMAHQDVVPIAPGTEAAWQQPPYSGAISNGYVWGRGALDDKVSLAALFEALSTLIQNEYVPRRTTYFYFGDDEEIGGKTAVKASEYFASRGIHFEYVIDEGGVITSGLIPNISKPVALIGVTEKAILNLKLSVDTVGGHSSLPTAYLAIGEMSQAISNILAHPPASDIVGPTRMFLETMVPYQSFMFKACVANLWLCKPLLIRRLSDNPLMAAMMHTTQAPTIFNAGIKTNVLPYHAEAIVNFRLAPFNSAESIISHVKSAINNQDIHVDRIDQSQPSLVSSTTGIGYQLLTSDLKAAYNNDIVVLPFVMTGGTDSRHFTAIADNVYRFLPVVVTQSDMVRFHGTNERYGTDAFIRMIRFYYAALSN